MFTFAPRHRLQTDTPSRVQTPASQWMWIPFVWISGTRTRDALIIMYFLHSKNLNISLLSNDRKLLYHFQYINSVLSFAFAQKVFTPSHTCVFQFDIGIPSMTKCCNQHDRCYDTCGREKHDCDKQFHDCLETICRNVQRTLGLSQSVQGKNKLVLL